nr:restriction endonuclease [Clostridium sp. KNHs216]
MKFQKHGRNFKDVCQFFIQAGYHAISPHTITTVRGSVEVDVLVEAPDELVKSIICECKFWNKAVPKEKVHAFRIVVNDSGASLGLLISKAGFQSGAIEAAKLSNVKLLTWKYLTELIENKWIINQLKSIKRESIPISEYTNPLHFPYEKLKESDKAEYHKACNMYAPLRWTCWMIAKSDLLKNTVSSNWYEIAQYSSIESYITFLSNQLVVARDTFKKILDSSGIVLPQERFEKLEGYTYMFLN